MAMTRRQTRGATTLVVLGALAVAGVLGWRAMGKRSSESGSDGSGSGSDGPASPDDIQYGEGTGIPWYERAWDTAERAWEAFEDWQYNPWGSA